VRARHVLWRRRRPARAPTQATARWQGRQEEAASGFGNAGSTGSTPHKGGPSTQPAGARLPSPSPQPGLQSTPGRCCRLRVPSLPAACAKATADHATRKTPRAGRGRRQCSSPLSPLPPFKRGSPRPSVRSVRADPSWGPRSQGRRGRHWAPAASVGLRSTLLITRARACASPREQQPRRRRRALMQRRLAPAERAGASAGFAGSTCGRKPAALPRSRQRRFGSGRALRAVHVCPANTAPAQHHPACVVVCACHSSFEQPAPGAPSCGVCVAHWCSAT
jgi:hypothetical protein